MVPSRKIRIALLLGVLAWVALDALADRLNSTDWKQPLWVGVYPINADGSEATASYIAALREEDFSAIDTWLAAEATRYGLALDAPLRMRLGPELKEMPPLPPADRGLFGTITWSLALRYWADDHDALTGGLRPDIRLFLLFRDPSRTQRLPHSLGLAEGLVGIVHVFADKRQAGSNRVVIAHEMLHTLGASDKYDPLTTQPRFPEGFADPTLSPRFPQAAAEIMGGRIPVSETKSEIPGDIDDTRIGAPTAAEIRWR